MEAFVNFIKEYWQFIGTGLLLIIEVLLLILKRKKPEVLTDGILALLEEKVDEAEKIFGSGVPESKMNFVLKEVQKVYPTASNSAIKARVEYLLTLPQKKGVTKYGKKI